MGKAQRAGAYVPGAAVGGREAGGGTVVVVVGLGVVLAARRVLCRGLLGLLGLLGLKDQTRLVGARVGLEVVAVEEAGRVARVVVARTGLLGLSALVLVPNADVVVEGARVVTNSSVVSSCAGSDGLSVV